MNDYSRTVLWLGLLMIVLQIVSNWKLIASVIFSSPPGAGTPFNTSLIPPLSGPKIPGEEPAPEEPAPEVPEIPVLAAYYVPASKG